MATEKRLIDANALIESGYDVTLDEVFPDWHELPESVQEAVCKHGQYLKKLIQQQPTVDAVEVVHGEWSIIEDDYDDATILECSVCEVSFRFYEYDGLLPQAQTYHYCPNCGAKMDGDGNGT